MAGFNQDVALIKPQYFVNNTGGAVVALVENYKPDFKNILFVYDDVNLEFGKLRLRSSGSAGGHHGLESVINDLNSEEFPRLRIGIKNENMPQDLTNFVLAKFSEKEQNEYPEIINKAVSVCEDWINNGFDAAVKKLSQLQG